jgi:hypothetical protein
MNADEKMAKLALMSEEHLRESVLLPLLSRMGFKYVSVYHGSGERGKDIVCFDTNRLGKREYMAVVAKATELDGNVSSSASLQAALNQVQQCFDTEYCDLFGMKRVTMDRVWIVTCKRIVPGSEATIFGTLEKSNLSKLVSFVDCNQLIKLLDEHYPSYWDARTEPIDVVREQRDRLLSFVKLMLAAMGGDTADIEATLNEVMLSPTPPNIVAPADRSISRLRPYAVEIDRIAPEHSHNFFSREDKLIKETFLESKRLLYYSITGAEDLVDCYEKVVAIEDPIEFVKEFNLRLDRKHGFSNLPFEWVSEAMHMIGDLEDALNDVEPLRERLRQIGKLDWATEVLDSLNDLPPEIEAFLREADQESFTFHWHIEMEAERGRVRLRNGTSPASSEDGFITCHDRIIEPFFGDERRELTTGDVMAAIRHRVRERFDKLLAAHGMLEDE